MSTYDGARDRQSEASAADLRIAVHLSPEERCKDGFALRFQDARTVIRDDDVDSLPAAGRRDGGS